MLNPMAQVDLSIVFVNYKTEELLLNCLKSLKQHVLGISYECIVVDNCYQPALHRDIIAQFPEIVWQDARGNTGFSKANNIGASLAKGEYLLFLNCDTLIFDQSIQNALHFLKSHPDYACLGGNQVDPEFQRLPYYRSLNDIRKDFYFLPTTGIFKKALFALLPKENFTDGTTNNLVGAFMMMPKDIFEKAGQWDEDFFMYAEDAEFSHRLTKFGKLGYLKEVNYIHLIKHNEFRRTTVSWGNRFSVQIQLSNFLWIRKSYGVLPLLLIYLNYLIFIPIFWIWKVYRNLIEGKGLFQDMSNQQLLTQKTGILLRYLPSLITLSKRPFKILPEENIGNI